MTLTYNIETWFLFATDHPIMMCICANLFFKIPARMTTLLAGQNGLLFVLSFFPRGVLDEILNLTESVSEGFPSYSSLKSMHKVYVRTMTLTFNLVT